MIVEIKNDKLTVRIKSFGAEITSLIDNETQAEYIWCGDAKYWGRQAPLLFPSVGFFPENTTLIDGKPYEILIHGFIRDFEHDIIAKSPSSVTFECRYNEETLKRFPYKFIFQVTYSIVDKTLEHTFLIKNLSETDMPFSLGGHTAFNCPIFEGEQFSDYRIDFLKNTIKAESQLTDEQREVTVPEENFQLSYETFRNGAKIYENLEANELKLYNPATNKGLCVKYRGFPLLGLWTPETIDSPFICIEPWLGMTDKKATTPIEFRKNPLFTALEPNQYCIKAYSVTIL